MKSFSLIIVAIAVGVQTLTDEQKEKLDQIHQECKNLTGVRQDRIEKILNGQFVGEPKMKSQILCVLKKTGVMSDSDDLAVDVIKNKLKKVTDADEEVDRIVKKCVMKKTTPEDTAFHTYRCLHENKPSFSPVL